MKSIVEPLEGNKVKLRVDVDAEEFEKAIDSAFRKIAREVRLPGFRPGKAPRKVLEARLGTGFARTEALRESLPEYYFEAVREHQVDVIAAPEFDVTAGQEDGPVSFDAVVEVRPKINIGGYGSLRVEIIDPLPSDAEIDEQLDVLRGQFGELESVSRPAIDADHVKIDISTEFEGETVEGLTADDYVYEVGSGAVVPELDEQLRGSKVGDILKFAAPHPDPETDSELEFRILVKDVQEKKLPEPDDEFAAEASEFDTLDELREDLAVRIATMKRQRARAMLRDRTIEALSDLVDIEIPTALVDAELQDRVQNLAVRLQSQGLDFDAYLQATGTTSEQFVAELRGPAEQSARADLALRAVADAEGLVPTDDEVMAELAELSERTGQDVEAIRTQLEANGAFPSVRSDLAKQRALEWLLEQVEIVDGDGQPVDRTDLEEPEPEEPDDAASEPDASAPTGSDDTADPTEEETA